MYFKSSAVQCRVTCCLQYLCTL